MISYAYWQSHFGGDAHVLGRTVRVYDRALPIAECYRGASTSRTRPTFVPAR